MCAAMASPAPGFAGSGEEAELFRRVAEPVEEDGGVVAA
jgi:hypothetical protein